MAKKLRASVVGCVMGKAHAMAYSLLDEYELCALCDLSQEPLEEVGKETGCAALFNDYGTMLSQAKPDVVCIATPNNLHETMTLEAVHAGARGIYCEKPISISMGSALRMQKACEDAGVSLVIGHQRRMSSPYLKMRELIAGGAIGEVTLIRGSCAGDFLSDGTHLIDSIMFLNGDQAVRWVLGQLYRGRKATTEELVRNRFQYCGTRYGHNVEEGAISVFEFENGVRAETQTGTVWVPARGYQDIEVFGTKGRLLRAGDGANPALMMENGDGWKAVNFENVQDGLVSAHREFADSIHTGKVHPMGIGNAISGFEVVMAIYESARLHAKLEIPLKQMEYPLDVMLREGGIN